jgi:hypothetical protein
MNQNGESNSSDLLISSATELLIGASPAQRAEAAQNLGRIGNKLAATYLIQGLSDTAPEVRLAAVRVLADLGDSAAIEPLSRLLVSETSPLVDRSAILGALAVLRGRNSTDVPADVNPSEPASTWPMDMQTSVDAAPAQRLSDFTEAWPSKEDAIEIRDLPEPSSAAPVVWDYEGERLAESHGRAAAERELLEEARRRSNEEASRRAAEETLRLETEAESISRLQEDLTRRRLKLEIAGKIAKEEEATLSEIDVRIQTETVAREKALTEHAHLEAESRRQATEARVRIAELQRRTTEQQDRAVENQRSLERMIRLRDEGASQHRAEEERLIDEHTALQQATDHLSVIRADVQAAREEAEGEALRLKEARELLQIEQEAYCLAEQERLSLETEVKVRAGEERRRLTEMRSRAAESRRSEEEATRQRLEEESRLLAELEAVRKGCEKESEKQAAREQKLRSEIESLRDATQQQLRSIEEAEGRKKSEEEAFRLAQQQAQQQNEEARRRRSEEDSRLKAEHAALIQMEDETRRRLAEQQQLIKDARLRGDAEKRRLQELQTEARRTIAEDQQKIREAVLNAEADAQRLSESQAMKAKLEQNAKQTEQELQELRTKIESMRQSTERQRRVVEEVKAQLLAQEEQFRLLELEQLSTEEALHLKGEGHQKRIAGLSLELAELREQTNQRSQQEADLRAEIEALNRTAADQMASIHAAEDQRSGGEQRILEANDLLEKIQQEIRSGVEQEKELRAAREAALARAEAEAQARAQAEAERRTQKRKQLEAEEKELAQQTEELARRKAAVDASRRVLEDGARRLAEVQEQITSAETAQRRAEHERLRLEAEVRLRAEKEEERLKETRERIAEAHKEIGALRYRADEEERQLEDLRALLASSEKASEKRTKLKRRLATEIEAVKPNGNGSSN